MSKFKNISKELLEEYYLYDHLSLTKCGKIFDCVPNTVFNYLQKYNIPIRSKQEAQLGRKLTEEDKIKIGLSKLGKKRAPFSEEWHKNLCLSAKGRIPPNLGKKASDETRKKQSESHKGISRTEEWNRKNSEAQKLRCSIIENCPMYGKHHTEETKKKMGLKGDKNPAWKGGCSTEAEKYRRSDEYKQWMKLVYKRDQYKCHRCNNGGKLTAHHIINFAKLFHENQYLFDINNGITFCIDCHKQFHRKYGTKNNNQHQIFEFVYLNN